MLIDISLMTMLLLAGEILLGIAIMAIAILLYRWLKYIIKFLNILQEAGMTKDDLTEMIDRRFVLMLKDDRLFRRHIEREIVTTKK